MGEMEGKITELQETVTDHWGWIKKLAGGFTWLTKGRRANKESRRAIRSWVARLERVAGLDSGDSESWEEDEDEEENRVEWENPREHHQDYRDQENHEDMDPEPPATSFVADMEQDRPVTPTVAGSSESGIRRYPESLSRPGPSSEPSRVLDLTMGDYESSDAESVPGDITIGPATAPSPSPPVSPELVVSRVPSSPPPQTFQHASTRLETSDRHMSPVTPPSPLLSHTVLPAPEGRVEELDRADLEMDVVIPPSPPRIADVEPAPDAILGTPARHLAPDLAIIPPTPGSSQPVAAPEQVALASSSTVCQTRDLVVSSASMLPASRRSPRLMSPGPQMLSPDMGSQPRRSPRLSPSPLPSEMGSQPRRSPRLSPAPLPQ